MRKSASVVQTRGFALSDNCRRSASTVIRTALSLGVLALALTIGFPQVAKAADPVCSPSYVGAGSQGTYFNSYTSDSGMAPYAPGAYANNTPNPSAVANNEALL